MAATQAGKRLTEAHRLAQARLAAQAIRELLTAWPLLDPFDLDATAGQWLRVVTPIVELRRRNSANLAANYLTRFRTFELGASDGFLPDRTETVTPEQLATSLVVTGPVALKDNMRRGLTVAHAAKAAQLGSARAASRHVLNGGRDLTTRSVLRDDRALGWARVVSGGPCHFCAMLASRGPVYKSRVSAGDNDRWHDNCSCSVEPVYEPDADWPPGSRRYHDMWKQAKAADGPTDITFRQLVEGRA